MSERHSFEKNNLILLVLSTAASVINYLFQILLGRLLSVEEFGIVNSIFSLISVLTIPGMIIAVVVAKECATVDENRKEAIDDTISVLLRFAGLIILVIGCIEISCTELFKNVFHLSKVEYIIIGICVSLIAVLVQTVYSILQGKRQFFELGMQSLITALFKMLLSIILVVLGGGIFSILAAYFVAELITLIYCVMSAKINFHCMKSNRVSIREKWGIWKYSISYILISQLGITLLSNGDVLLVKALFSDEVTGLYSSAITFSRVPLFITLSLANVLLPTVVNYKKQGKETYGLLLKSLFYGFVPWLCATLLLQLFGSSLIKVFYGVQYIKSADYFMAINIYILSLILLTIIMNYAISIEKIVFFAWSILLGVIVCIGVGICLKNYLEVMIMGLGVVLLIVAVVNVVYLMMNELKERKKINE